MGVNRTPLEVSCCLAWVSWPGLVWISKHMVIVPKGRVGEAAHPLQGAGSESETRTVAVAVR